MRRRGLVLGVVGACALAAVTTVTTTATGQAAQEPASPGVLTAMQRDLGLTAEGAAARLRQEATASRISSSATEAAGSAYGGSWFDAGRGRLVVGVTEAAPSRTVAAVQATGAAVERVGHSQAQLKHAKAGLDSYAERTDVPADIASWRVDPRAGSVVVSVTRHADGDAVRRFFDHANGPVTIERVAEKPRTFAAGTVGGDPYYINGNTRCSIGFSVQGGFVSAGHCGAKGSSTTGWDGSALGTFEGSSFPDNDYAFVRIGNGWWTEPVVLGHGAVSDQIVRGSNVAAVGSSICRSGSTTGWHCGTVQGMNETVNYSDGAVVHQLTKTSVCAEPGDSGGSFISGDQAQGVTSGGTGDCSGGGNTWFQPVNEILNTYGLNLVTG